MLGRATSMPAGGFSSITTIGYSAPPATVPTVALLNEVDTANGAAPRVQPCLFSLSGWNLAGEAGDAARHCGLRYRPQIRLAAFSAMARTVACRGALG